MIGILQMIILILQMINDFGMNFNRSIANDWWRGWIVRYLCGETILMDSIFDRLYFRRWINHILDIWFLILINKHEHKMRSLGNFPSFNRSIVQIRSAVCPGMARARSATARFCERNRALGKRKGEEAKYSRTCTTLSKTTLTCTADAVNQNIVRLWSPGVALHNRSLTRAGLRRVQCLHRRPAKKYCSSLIQ